MFPLITTLIATISVMTSTTTALFFAVCVWKHHRATIRITTSCDDLGLQTFILFLETIHQQVQRHRVVFPHFSWPSF